MVSLIYEDHELGIFPKEPRSSITTESASDVNLKSSKLSVQNIKLPQSKMEAPHNGRVNDMFNAMRYVLLFLGRFPFVPSQKFKTTCETGNSPETFRGRNYSSSIKSLPWIYFGVTSSFLAILLILSIGSFGGVFLSWSFFSIPQWTPNQKKLFENNLIPFVLVWSCLLSATVGNLSFFWNRKNISKFLNYWNVAVEIMEIQLPNNLKQFLYMSNLWFLTFSVIAVLSTKVLKIDLARGGSELIGVLALRVFIPNIDEIEGVMWICRVLGVIIILYAMYSSRAMLFFFIFKCKILRHCIKEWNKRLYNELEKPKPIGPEELQNEEINCKKIFDDHVVMLKLVRLTDKVFASILLSYFGSQILNMCFELFYVALYNPEDESGLDTSVAILLLIQNIYVFLSVSLHAAFVAEEANKGFGIVKRKGISVHDSVVKRHLLISLQISFQQRICITGGHYFVVDKPFIITVLGAVFTYFIIIIQYYGYKFSSP